MSFVLDGEINKHENACVYTECFGLKYLPGGKASGCPLFVLSGTELKHSGLMWAIVMCWLRSRVPVDNMYFIFRIVKKLQYEIQKNISYNWHFSNYKNYKK